MNLNIAFFVRTVSVQLFILVSPVFVI